MASGQVNCAKTPTHGCSDQACWREEIPYQPGDTDCASQHASKCLYICDGATAVRLQGRLLFCLRFCHLRDALIRISSCGPSMDELTSPGGGRCSTCRAPSTAPWSSR
jgi:hypothetical protein